MAGDAAPAGTQVSEEGSGPEPPVMRPDSDVPRRRRRLLAGLSGRPIRQALVFGLVTVLVLAVLVSWLAIRTGQSRRAEHDRAQFLQAGRQAAVDLTSMDYATVDADVSRILISSIGKFHDEFQARSLPLVDLVKQSQSKSVGTVAEAALESIQAGNARVLVVVKVKTTTPAQPDEPPKGWRMRIDVQRVGSAVKVSNVEFVQ